MSDDPTHAEKSMMLGDKAARPVPKRRKNHIEAIPKLMARFFFNEIFTTHCRSYDEINPK